jgi:nicotinamidase-related amidase
MANQFGKAIKHFEKKGVYIMGSVDAHIGREHVPNTRDENLPLHCIKGTTGQQKIKSTQGEILYVSDQAYSKEALDLIITEIKKGKRVYFEKQTQSCSTNPNIKYIIQKLKVTDVYFIGVLTNVCIKFADSFFKELKIKTFLVKGAIKGNDFPGDTEKDAIKKMIESGTGFIDFK